MNIDVIHSAYHEFGHTIMGYFVDYAVNKVEVYESGDGLSYFDYKEDLPICSALMNLNNPILFQMLSNSQKNKSINVATKLFHMLLGGPSSEALSKVGFDFVGRLEVEASGPDLKRCESIEFFLRNNLGSTEFEDIQKTLSNVTTLLKTPLFSSTIKALVDRLCLSSAYKLNKTEIESVLIETGFLNYIRKISS
jgi:hypothetical protein